MMCARASYVNNLNVLFYEFIFGCKTDKEGDVWLPVCVCEEVKPSHINSNLVHRHKFNFVYLAISPPPHISRAWSLPPPIPAEMFPF